MKRFRAEAKDKDGKKYAGVFEAETETTARALLESEGFKITHLEELPEEENYEEAIKKVSKKVVASKGNEKKSHGKSIIEATKKRPLRILKIFIIAGLILLSFPLAIWLLSPEPPSTPPENVVNEFFSYEFTHKHFKQYDLFSDQLKMKFPSVTEYAKNRLEQKKQRYQKYEVPVSEDVAEVVDERQDTEPEIVEMKRVRDDARRVDMMVLVRVLDFHERHLLKLLAQNSEWKINSLKLISYESVVREPDEVENDLPEVIKLPVKRKAKTSEINGVEDIKVQALSMLEDALRQGKVTRQEYEARKEKIERL